MSEQTSRFVRVSRSLWRALTGTVLVVVNLLFLAIVLGVVLALLSDDRPKVPKTAALVVAPRGGLVEELSGDPLQRAWARVVGRQRAETLLKDVVDGIDAAAADDRIQAMLLDLDRFGGAGLSKLRAVRRAIDDFSAAGKKVIATGEILGQSAYYLASAADEIIMRPDGAVIIEGYGAYRTYYKQGLDRFGVDVHVFKVGDYKSYPEPYERSDMSPHAKEAYQDWMEELWTAWLEDVARARGLAVDQLRDLVNHADAHLLAAGGDFMKAVLDAGLVDELAPPDRVRDRMIELVGEDEDAHSFHRIGLGNYLESLDEDRFGTEARGDLVGVVVLRGDMIGGNQPPGTVGGDSTARLIRRARHDDHIKALVLRVDSGGGLSLVGEQLRREVELTREAGVPVVVSMSSVGASAAYHLAAAADEIWVNPTTLTGSIGVFAMVPTVQKPMERYLGMRVDGVGTTPFAGALRVDRALDERVRTMLKAGVDWSYKEFVGHVAEGRGLGFEQIDAIARGRVWSGKDALELGLVDELGDLDDAVASAAGLAGLGDDYELRYLVEELDLEDKLLVVLLSRAAEFIGPHGVAGTRGKAYSKLLEQIETDAEFLLRFSAEHGVVAHSRAKNSPQARDKVVSSPLRHELVHFFTRPGAARETAFKVPVRGVHASVERRLR
jgi:protease-4